MTSTAVEVISKAVVTAFTNQVVPALSEWLKGKGAEVTTEDLITFMTTNSVGGVGVTVPASQPKVPKLVAGKTCIATRRKPIAGKCTNPALEGSNYCRECRKTKKACDEEGPVAPVPKKRATKDVIKETDGEEGGEVETPEPAPTKAKKLPKVSDEDGVEPPHWEVVEAEQRLFKDLITGLAAVQDENDPTVYRYCGVFEGDELRETLTKDEEKEAALRKLEKYVGEEEKKDPTPVKAPTKAPVKTVVEEDDEETEDEAPKPKAKAPTKPVSKAPVKKDSEEKEEVEVTKSKAPVKKEVKPPVEEEPEEKESPKPKPKAAAKAPVKKEVKAPVKVPAKKEEEEEPEEEPEEVEEEKPQPIKKASTVKPPPMGGQKKDSKVDVPKNLPKILPAGLGKGVPKKAVVVDEADEDTETEE